MSEFDDFVDELHEQFLANARKLYSEKVIEHFLHPRNFRPLDHPDGRARITGPCGDTMEIFLRLHNERIAEAGFHTDGCVTTVASASMAVELATGKSLVEVRRITHKTIFDALDGLPKESRHCAILAANTLQAAVGDCLQGQKEPWRKLYRPNHSV